MINFRLISLLLLVFSLFACRIGPKKDKKKNAETGCVFCVDKSDFAPLKKTEIGRLKTEITDYYDRTFDVSGFNGAFLVAKNGNILVERYSGYAHKKEGTLLTANTPLHIASISKVLTATAIFRLVESQQLRLDQKVRSVLPTFPYPQISIRMLLNHRSGVPKYANFSEPDSVWGVERILHNAYIVELLAKFKFPLDFVPDTKFVYNNSNYALLASVVEKKMKKSFKKAMQELVFEPLGMTNTFVFLLENDQERVSQSYSTRMELQRFDNLDAIYGDKNIYSTPRDLLKFDLAMQKNHFISEKLKREIFKGYSYEKPGIKNYGLGIRLKEWDTGEKLFFHNGWWHGNRASYVTMKKEGVTMIAITNANSRRVYDIARLSAMFGDYPFDLVEEEEEIETVPIELPPVKDSLLELKQTVSEESSL